MPFRDLIIHALSAKNVDEKLNTLKRAWSEYLVKPDIDLNFENVNLHVGMPENLKFVSPRELESRRGDKLIAKQAMLHAVAHIEFNAINLALDAMLRFSSMPKQYYADWFLVAREEAYHFELLRTHLREMGCEYGDLPVHGGLSEMAEKTQHSVLARMALVPRLLEARGLDMAPIIMQKLKSQGDIIAFRTLWIILHDEVGHVSIGNRWFHWCCMKENQEPLLIFKQLLQQHAPDVLKKPFNWSKRLEAGFTEEERVYIEQLVI